MAGPVDICALCREIKELRESHLLAAGFLRLLRDARLTNPNPFLMSTDHVGQTSAQAKQYLLCDTCEQRFSTQGEKWVIRNCYRTEGSFRLRDLVRTNTPIFSGPEGRAHDASQVSGIDIGKLVFFSASVIWRASLRKWRIQKQVYEPLVVGNYQEELRLYLLGESPFPQQAVAIVYVSTSDVPPLTAMYPDVLGELGFDIYRFYIPGIWFHLLLGEGLTDDHRSMCILRSPNHPICFHTSGDSLIHSIGRTLYWAGKQNT